MELSPHTLLERIRVFRAFPQYWVAYSGGLDSHVLLHALTRVRRELPGRLGAVHVDHALHADSGRWVAHCREVCAALSVPFVALRVDARPRQGQSPEAVARDARYRAFARWLAVDACLLSAHHLDDQAETLLLQLLRGAGPHGLAAMPASMPLGRGTLLRPLLEAERSALRAYAESQGLAWIEDPSNLDTGLDRNFLRREVLPLLRSRWPSTARALSRSAAHCAEAATLLDAVAEQDLESVRARDGETLSVAWLRLFPPERQRNILRHWFRGRALPVPSRAVLRRIQAELIDARPDAGPLVCWDAVESRRYRDDLYVMWRLAAHDPRQRFTWRVPEPLPLPGAGGTLHAQACVGEGIRKSLITDGMLGVGFRQGGERCRPAGRRHHHRLKTLLQEGGVPPWERARLPLIYVRGELAAVAGLCVCEPFQARPGEAGVTILWRRMQASRTAVPESRDR
jgi:tRNA(Ile)-lysidine synthase